uniref:DWNN domain-containing protein n=1 Tax=Leptobrachium leishanense TaxID=445787 RepID=A0A8C5R2H5_9ANUR
FISCRKEIKAGQLGFLFGFLACSVWILHTIEYTEDAALIPRHSSVIVRRIPSNEVKTSSKTYDKSRSEPVSGTSKAVCNHTITLFLILCS